MDSKEAPSTEAPHAPENLIEVTAWIRGLSMARHGVLAVADPLGSRAADFPTLYMETTIPSYLTSRLSRDTTTASHQIATRNWWNEHRFSYMIYVSHHVCEEAAAGDRDAARRRLDFLAPLPLLDANETATELAAEIMASSHLPAHALADARHVAIAAVHGMQFLLTWNCRHLANANIIPTIVRVCANFGHVCPQIRTPLEMFNAGIRRET